MRRPRGIRWCPGMGEVVGALRVGAGHDDRGLELTRVADGSPLHWASQCILQIARSPILGRRVLAQLLEPPCTDPYARWCGRGGAARLPPIPIFDPNVWSGRALQEVFVDLADVVLHQCIRSLIGACAPDHHGYQRACDLISGEASNGLFGSPVFARAGKTDPPSSSHSLADLGG
jgi:hypothetical protein